MHPSRLTRTRLILAYAGIHAICSGFLVYGSTCGGGFQYAGWPSTNGPTVTVNVYEDSFTTVLNDMNIGDPTDPIGGTPRAQRLQAVKNALNAWSSQPGSSFHYEYNGVAGPVDMDSVKMDCDDHGPRNTSIYVTTKSASAFDMDVEPGTLARTFAMLCIGGTVRNLQIELYDDIGNSMTSDPLGPSGRRLLDFQSYVTHELGHGLGLQHFDNGVRPPEGDVLGGVLISRNGGDPPCHLVTTDASGRRVVNWATPNAVMCWNLKNDDVHRVLESDDYLGLTTLYPGLDPLKISMTANSPYQGAGTVCLDRVQPALNSDVPVTVQFEDWWLDGNNLNADLQLSRSFKVAFSGYDDYQMCVNYSKHNIGNDEVTYFTMTRRAADNYATVFWADELLERNNIAEVRYIANRNVAP
jgi:hypothetical protein